MSHIQYVDELVKEYLLFRGFSQTLKAFDNDLKTEKEKGFRVRTSQYMIWRNERMQQQYLLCSIIERKKMLIYIYLFVLYRIHYLISVRFINVYIALISQFLNASLKTNHIRYITPSLLLQQNTNVKRNCLWLMWTQVNKFLLINFFFFFSLGW